ncbi:MAG: alpha/beta fold hydrolase [Bacteroidales bacterium]|jgi:uncharacterized protein|nr:alpha/beta fold hydrolase [Bacteroidales bacterium]MDD2204951.1 alpha/beta fold hydrolase [Bacteroidales bacterium]MDD3152172.1 alpha/beta fold hydrolase [Bacteroidales bacterium]MDD3913892.1 alpha/beta fold hydrolase [Bacteroidales bacterium]MDD4634268.1 alpha/beta fold hydrolase [Bacteroidales bacterium]
MKKSILIFLIITITSCLYGQNIIDTWNTKLNVNGQSLAIVIHIKDTIASHVTLDSPDQYAYGLKCDTVSFIDDKIYIGLSQAKIEIKGQFDKEKDVITGKFSQMAFSCDVEFVRGDYIKEKNVRPQDPTDFPYYQEDIFVTDSTTSVTLAATLTMPDDVQAESVVILISGSGAQNRNEEVLDHRPFLVLSDFLTRNGIAVIRYDDRGTAESTGNFAGSTTYDFADDVESIVNYIHTRNELKNMKIGLAGHSEGGMIAPIVASRRNDIDFLVLLAAPAVPITKLYHKQLHDLMAVANTPEEILSIEDKFNKKAFDILTNDKLSKEEKYDKCVKLRKKSYLKYPEGWIGNMDVDLRSSEEISMYMSPWMYEFINFEPAVYLSQINIPVLALNGTNDLQVNCDQNFDEMNKILQKAGNTNYKIMKLEGLNHIFQKCIFGAPALYAKNKETFNEDAMKIIAEWIHKM